MDCTTARELVSAQIDGDVGQSAEVDAHLATCAECRAWKEDAHGLERRLIHSVAAHGPRRRFIPPTPRGFERYRAIRLVLAWIGVLLIAWNLPDLFAGGVDVERVQDRSARQIGKIFSDLRSTGQHVRMRIFGEAGLGAVGSIR